MVTLCLAGILLEATVHPETGDAAADVKELPQLKIVLFNKPGCGECADVRDMLAELESLYPRLAIEQHNIDKVDAMRLNEALCRRFGVPDKHHLVAPAVFAGGGYLVKDEITFGALNQLVAQSQGVPLAEWYVAPEHDFDEADKAISSRYAALSLGVVIGAGLLDSINPCAFATIIFFVSYLQVSRRSRRQIVQVCLAFIVGVFLTYFLLGLGMSEIVAELEILQRFGTALNWAMAIFVGLAALLNVRDGILCMQQRHKEMSLQLPNWLRKRINAVIRKGARHSRFVMAAFAVGVVISLLELACTGQVYAPTILYMMKTGQEYLGTLTYLLLYNLAFVTPLLAILALTWFGLRSETLTGVLQRHAAAVKFATAGLFIIMLLTFILAGRL